MSDRLAPTSHSPASVCREVHPGVVASLLGELRVVDVREPHEFDGELGHLPGALLAPLGRLTDACVGWDRHTPTLLVCRSGARSARAATLLAQLGFTRLYHLAGGMLAWAEEGLPVVR